MHTTRGGKREGKFRSGRLPLATSLPAIADAFDPKSKLHPPRAAAALLGRSASAMAREA